jgi:hypothetical protein
MTTKKSILVLVFLITGTLMAQQAKKTQPETKVTQLLSKDLTGIPNKEGVMITVEYPPRWLGSCTSPQRKRVRLRAGGFGRDAGERRTRSDFGTWSDFL